MNDRDHNPNGRVTPPPRTDPCVQLGFRYRLRHTVDALQPDNRTLLDVLHDDGEPCDILPVADSGVAACWPNLEHDLHAYAKVHSDRLQLVAPMQIVPGGEAGKNDQTVFHGIVEAIHNAGLCRHSYVLAIGGGAMLDVVGFAAATAHRGVRLIRMPTTTLAQGDAGIGVKNGINLFGKKNFLGTFAVPWAVVNDEAFLRTLSDRDWRCGLSEAVKVALVKDEAFFDDIEAHVARLAQRDAGVTRPILQRCAQLHLDHIVHGGDPFELTAARPLDFGHWSAHKLEQMSDYDIRHGEAVAIGIALDVLYCRETNLLSEVQTRRVLDCLSGLGFALYDQRLSDTETLFGGLDEFREHLGGRLTIALIDDIGAQVDVHEIDHDAMRRAIGALEARATAAPAARGDD